MAQRVGQIQRISKIIQEFDAQGWHRTGTTADQESARWLVNKGQNLGVALTLESFHLNRVAPHECYLEVGERIIQGLPIFDGGFTAREGISGRIGFIGSSAQIGLSRVGRASGPLGAEPDVEFQKIRRSKQHEALVAVASGESPGLMASNAPDFCQPFGLPVLQVSSEEEEWLTNQALSNSLAHLVVSADRVESESFNVTGSVAGRNSETPPLIVMTPRSGWWQCASERGAGLACWLEVMRTMSRSRPYRDIIFVATSAHELGLLGLDDFLERRPSLVQESHVWLHFGADIGMETRFSGTDHELQSQTSTVLNASGVKPATPAHVGDTVGAESQVVARAGGRVAAIVGHSPLFHLEADRWPEAIDPEAISKVSNAFTNLALQMSGE
ncbi:MAG: M28 family peptidase [Chloroflexota bacterium]|nr:M28 family peptidase [Chloroflexota bacterium]